MEKELEGKIDEAWKKKLENSVSQKPLTIIAAIRETPEVTKAIDAHRYRRPNPEERRADQEAEEKMMEPVLQYLDSLKVQYNVLYNLHDVIAQMNPRQILDFAKQPYIKEIILDMEIKLFR
ncbi:Uncharacterised protein [uncultured archaeon]|nr:Uncharacterised protein [uncultured archaeon]